ncbi:MAG: TonB-dependent receptor, partial [Sphingomonas sp.]
MKGYMLSLATGTALVGASAAVAQDRSVPQPAGDAAVAASPSGQAADAAPGDIVVTARRRAERLQDVPLSVTAFSPEALDDARIVGRTDLANFTPSLITITGGLPSEFAFFALRGQGPAFGSVPGVI